MVRTYVKTVYEKKSCRESNVTAYPTKEEAWTFIRACLRWGIGIESCKIIPKPKTKK